MFFRTLLFQAAFYLFCAVAMLLLLPSLLLPTPIVAWLPRFWGWMTIFLHRWTTGIRSEVRGRENIAPGPLLVAAKHQSAYETAALIGVFERPAFILKRELTRIPVFGWYLVKIGMIPVDRGGRGAMASLLAASREALADGRQLVIFPEGTRREPGAAPDYKAGVAVLYRDLGVACLPVALNSGLYWPRRSRRHAPGTIVVSILPAIPPGLPLRAFQDRLVAAIEAESDRLLIEAADRGEGLFSPAAAARVATLRT